MILLTIYICGIIATMGLTITFTVHHGKPKPVHLWAVVSCILLSWIGMGVMIYADWKAHEEAK